MNCKSILMRSLALTIPFSSLLSVSQMASAQEVIIQEQAYSADQIIVKFKDDATALSVASVLAKLGLTVKKEIQLGGRKKASQDVVSVLRVKAGSVKSVISALQDSGLVHYAEPDYKVSIGQRVGTDAIPNDTDFSSLWGLNNEGQTGGVFDADIDAVEAWDTVTGNTDAIIAVIDTGVDYTHSELADNMWQNPGEIPGNGIDDDNNGYIDDVYGIDCANDDSDPFDDEGHGTHVAGTIGARGDNASAIVGVNWQAQIMALKFLDASGSGSTSDAIECVNYSNMMKANFGQNVAVTNNSWGGGGFSTALSEAIDEAEALDILFVAAAGNSGTDNDVSPHYPANYSQDIVVSVAASNHNDDLAYFSNYGATSVDLAAPGESILSTLPGETYGTYNGTSMATPHVAGAAILALADDPNQTAMGLKAQLLALGDSDTSFQGGTVSGRRLNIGNVIGCVPGVPTMSIVSPQQNGNLVLNQETVVSARLIDCGSPVTATDLEATMSDGYQVTLLDDGLGADAQAGDGLHSAFWTPSIEGTLSVTVESPSLALTDQVSVTVSDIIVYQVDDTEVYPVKDVTVGELLSISSSDDSSSAVDLGFPFTFYGIDYQTIYVGTNGQIVFGAQAGSTNFSNTILPLSSTPNNLIAAYWDDLNPSANGNIYVLREGEAPNRQVTIGWVDVNHYSYSGGISFQVTLTEGSDDILVNYPDVDFGSSSLDSGISATVGVEDATGEYATLYSFNESSLTSGMSIKYYTEYDPTIPLVINDESPEKYGWNFDGISNAEQTATFTFNSEGTHRWLHVRGHDIDYDDEVCIDLNDQPFTCLKTTANDMTRAVEQVIRIPSTLQVAGENTITFNQKTPGWKWGITDLGIFDHNLRHLPVDEINESKYGWRWVLKSHKNELKYGFYSDTLPTDSDAIFVQLEGYDINLDDEVCVFLNQTQNSENFLGCLLVGPSMDLTEKQYIHLPNSMLKDGLNVLTFKQKTQGMRWGVTNAGLLPVNFGSYFHPSEYQEFGVFSGELPSYFSSKK